MTDQTVSASLMQGRNFGQRCAKNMLLFLGILVSDAVAIKYCNVWISGSVITKLNFRRVIVQIYSLWDVMLQVIFNQLW